MESTANEKFKKSLSLGEKWERVVALMLLCNGYGNIKWGHGEKEFDIRATKNDKEVKFEVKADYYKYTGNMALEVEYKGNPSGISTTTADWLVYVFTKIDDINFYFMFIKPEKLKALIKSEVKHMNIMQGGDNKQSKLVMLPVQKYKSHFKIKTFKKL